MWSKREDLKLKSLTHTLLTRDPLPKRNVALSSACSEVGWIWRFLDEPGFPQHNATPLNADNASTILISENPVLTATTYVKLLMA